MTDYCKCEKKKQKTMGICGDIFKVCAKSLGGCGKEIIEDIEKETIQKIKKSLDDRKTKEKYEEYWKEYTDSLGNKNFPGLFIEFLHKEGCYTEFKKSLYNRYEGSLEEMFNRVSFDGYVHEGICWEKEKYPIFWANLNNKWVEICESLRG